MCASKKASSCTDHRDTCPYDWTKGLTRVRGTFPPLLLCWPFLPNSLDSQQFWVKAGHDAAHVSSSAQDGASGSP